MKLYGHHVICGGAARFVWKLCLEVTVNIYLESIFTILSTFVPHVIWIDMAERNVLPISSMLLTSTPEQDPSPLSSWDMPTNFEDLPPEYSQCLINLRAEKRQVLNRHIGVSTIWHHHHDLAQRSYQYTGRQHKNDKAILLANRRMVFVGMRSFCVLFKFLISVFLLI